MLDNTYLKKNKDIKRQKFLSSVNSRKYVVRVMAVKKETELFDLK